MLPAAREQITGRQPGAAPWDEDGASASELPASPFAGSSEPPEPGADPPAASPVDQGPLAPPLASRDDQAGPQASGALRRRLQVVHGLAPVGVAVAASLLGAAALLFAARPQATPLSPAVASTEDRLSYQTTLTGDLSGPLAVAIGPQGEVYVADSGNGLVRVFDAYGSAKSAIGRKATGTPEPGTLAYPVGLALDGQRVYVADNVSGHISVFDQGGQFLEYFAEGEAGRPFGTPGSLWWKDGLLYVSDLTAHRVVALAADGTVAQSFGAGKGSGPGQLLFPGSVWGDEAGRVFVADSNNHRVQVFSHDGSALGDFISPALNLPRGIVGGSGRLYIASTLGHAISVFTTGGQLLFSYGASGSGWTDLGFPNGVALAGDRLYVADRANNRVQVLLLPLPGR